MKVLLPKWWTELDKNVIGETDGQITFACSAEQCYYVSVPEFDYEGYFAVDDLKILKGKK